MVLSFSSATTMVGMVELTLGADAATAARFIATRSFAFRMVSCRLVQGSHAILVTNLFTLRWVLPEYAIHRVIIRAPSGVRGSGGSFAAAAAADSFVAALGRGMVERYCFRICKFFSQHSNSSRFESRIVVKAGVNLSRELPFCDARAQRTRIMCLFWVKLWSLS